MRWGHPARVAWTSLIHEEDLLRLCSTSLLSRVFPALLPQKAKEERKANMGVSGRGGLPEGSLCSAKNRTVRTLLSMPYSLRHRERRCPDAFVLYILYIFIYIR